MPLSVTHIQLFLNTFGDRVPLRFFGLIEVKGYHWIWVGPKKKGYGRFNHDHKNSFAHKIAYEAVNGPSPRIKKTCERKYCIHPNHWTIYKGFARKKACAKGHAPEHRTTSPAGNTWCRQCDREKFLAKKQAKRDVRLALIKRVVESSNSA